MSYSSADFLEDMVNMLDNEGFITDEDAETEDLSELAGKIFLTVGDLLACARAARQVVESWEQGDLALRIRELSHALDHLENLK